MALDVLPVRDDWSLENFVPITIEDLRAGLSPEVLATLDERLNFAPLYRLFGLTERVSDERATARSGKDTG
jgi:hypothetical protein